jgi:hypothetical protein
MTAFQVVSSLVIFFIAYTIFYNPNLRQHPADLIGYIFTILAILCYMSFSRAIICPGNGEVIFAATVYFDTSKESQLKAMKILTNSYLFI